MDRRQGGGNFPFGNPFGNPFGSIFGNRDPFDDPFFTQPFGNLMGPNIFRPVFNPFENSNFLPFQPFDQSFRPNFTPQFPINNNNNNRNNSRNNNGVVIRELNEEEQTELERNGEDRENIEHYVQEPNEETEERIYDQTQYYNRFNNNNNNPNNNNNNNETFNFQSSSVTYGGINGAYYTSSTTRRSGSNGVTVEESKEADTTTGRAKHRISRGINNKGHSVTRKLNSDGRVDTAEMLHNLQEDELPGFEEQWRGNARQNLPGWNPNIHNNGGGMRRIEGNEERNTRRSRSPRRTRVINIS